MYFSSNIKFLRKRRKKTQDDLAFALQMKRSTLSGYENNIAEPGISSLLRFSKYFGIAVDTLISVNLQELTESQLRQLEHGQDVFITGQKLRVLATTVDRNNNENIELVTEKAKAGYMSGFADPDYISELPVFRLPFLSTNKKYRTFQISGDSMLPIPDKSWVTGEFIQDWNNVLPGDACIVLTRDEGIVFKIVDNQLHDKGKLVLYSLNALYDPFEVEGREIREIWKFVHYISNEIPDPVIPGNEIYKTVANLKRDVERLKNRLKK